MLVVPKVYTLLSTYVLHVVNNDTGEEIPRVFQKVAPHVYTKNKVGQGNLKKLFTNIGENVPFFTKLEL